MPYLLYVQNIVKQMPYISVRTRFAPSPTGYLHMGHVVSAIYVWSLARKTGGNVELRIEDHDKERCKDIYAEAIIKDLIWLGFIEEKDRADIVQQSKRLPLYYKYLEKLKDKDKVFVCRCSRKDLDITKPYPGTCRNKNYPWEGEYTVRVKATDEPQVFNDLWYGKQVQKISEQCGDFSIMDRRKNFTYQFASVVDDIENNINVIIRGEDILDSTGRQLYLQKELTGQESQIIYGHHPLVYDENKQKLSKRFFSASISEEREKGVSAQEILQQAIKLINGAM